MTHERTDDRESAIESPGSEDRSPLQPLRIWPAVLFLLGMLVARWLPTLIQDGPANLWMSAAFGPALCGILILLWWLVASRATWRERLIGLLGIVVAIVATLALADKSMIGPTITVLTIPMGMAAFAIGAILCGRMLSFKRTVVALLLAACGFGCSALLRNQGVWGNFALGLQWRWVPSAEQQMLAEQGDRPAADMSTFADADIDDALAHPVWPGFRGPNRDGRQQGTSIASDWSATPPEPIWKIAVGPAWSSFVVAGSLLYTQEQRGETEMVVCYDANTGREIWKQQIEARFDDPLGGPGPGATPTLAGGGLFVMGATGWLMRLDPKTGEVVWQQNLCEVADRKPPMWGFASSPLVVDSVVIVYAGGAGDKGTLAFDVESGDLRWSAAAGNQSYSSAQAGTVAAEQVVLMLTNTGLNVLDPQTGSERLNYEWKHDGYRSLQPQVIGEDTILIPTGPGSGTRLIRITKDAESFVAEELWTSRNLKPDFNDFVVYDGHAYGFDNTIFTCIDLETGDRKWKGGHYGKGQVLLLEDNGLLLVVSEQGEVVLLKAGATAHTELAKFQALEGKTWNHPVVVGDRLYIRNAQEAACYRLPL